MSSTLTNFLVGIGWDTSGFDQGTKHILKGVDLTVNEGEIHAIMGPNGSGKSTLAYTIAGHPRYHVEGGSITFDGQDVLTMSVDERARVIVKLDNGQWKLAP